MSVNFDFLKGKFPALYNFGALAERYVYDDPNSCIIKVGMLAETIISLMFKYDHITIYSDENQASKIDRLYREDLLTPQLRKIFHYIRKARNKAAHENYASAKVAAVLLQMAYGICVWFYQVYGDYHFKPTHKFIMPKKQPTKSTAVADKPTEEKQEKQLIAQAEKTAADAPKMPKTERSKRAKMADNNRPRTEAETRALIDEALRQVGWEADTKTLRHSKGTRPQKGHNLAIAEWPTDSSVGKDGYADYALFIGLKLVGIIEAKAIHKDISSVLDSQCREYATQIRDKDQKQYGVGHWGDYKVPFIFATNGRPYLKQLETKSGIWCRDVRRPDNIPKALHNWMSPTGMMDALTEDPETGNKTLMQTPYDLLRDPDGLNLREYQIRAIAAAEHAIISGKRTVLLAMATGTGKTRTILGLMYRALKSNRFKRILYLVDRTSLGEQTEDVLKDVKLENLMTMNQIYNVKGLEDTTIDPETRIQVATVQSMMRRILYNDGDNMPAVTDYDLIIVDEAHRGYALDKQMSDDELLYTSQRDYQSKYRAVIDYFDAVKVALTATPALQTTQIFGEPVFNYSYREAVIEGYLVDHDAPHKLKTHLSEEGIHYKPGDKIILYDPTTNEIVDDGSTITDEPIDFSIEDFNRKVIVESFNRAVLEEIAKDFDPDVPEEHGKMLIYAANDAHADLIVKLLKEIYGKSGVDMDAIMKITGSAGGGDRRKIEQAIKRFKNERFPSVVVTVDLLTTGIDVPSITTLVFLRRVKSRILFEQMLGRATRLCPEIHKQIFDIYDPVGVYDALEPLSSMRPVVASPSKSMTQLLDELAAITPSDDAEKQADNDKHIKYIVDEVTAKLQRKKRTLSKKDVAQFSDMADGKTPDDVITETLSAKPEDARHILLSCYDAIKYIQHLHESYKVVVSDAPDKINEHTRGYGADSKRPEDYLESFSAFVKGHRDEITALNLVCTKPSDLTRADLKRLKLTLDREGYTEKQLNTALSQTSNADITADLISLIRRYAIGSPLLDHKTRIHHAVAKLKAAHDFTAQQKNWIDRIEKYLVEESVINVSVFDEDARFKSRGGYKRIDKVFGAHLNDVILELNTYLYEDNGGQTIA